MQLSTHPGSTPDAPQCVRHGLRLKHMKQPAEEQTDWLDFFKYVVMGTIVTRIAATATVLSDIDILRAMRCEANA